MSLQSRFAYKGQSDFPCIHDQAWPTIIAGYDATGYGYAD